MFRVYDSHKILLGILKFKIMFSIFQFFSCLVGLPFFVLVQIIYRWIPQRNSNLNKICGGWECIWFLVKKERIWYVKTIFHVIHFIIASISNLHTALLIVYFKHVVQLHFRIVRFIIRYSQKLRTRQLHSIRYSTFILVECKSFMSCNDTT